jgi:hypothetical protein
LARSRRPSPDAARHGLLVVVEPPRRRLIGFDLVVSGVNGETRLVTLDRTLRARGRILRPHDAVGADADAAATSPVG